MKEKLKIDDFKKIYKSDKFPYIILFFSMFLVNIFKGLNGGDDPFFANIITGNIESNINSIAQYIPWRYKLWSSRLIVEVFLILFTKDFFVIWKLLDSFIYVVLAYSLIKLFGKKESSNKFNWLVVLLILCIPYKCFGEAGWVASSLNYLWPISLGILSLIPIRKTIYSEKINKYEYILYCLACIFACNVEQVCGWIFLIYFVFNIYFCVKKNVKKINIVMLIISIISLIFILTCPRKLFENRKIN